MSHHLANIEANVSSPAAPAPQSSPVTTNPKLEPLSDSHRVGDVCHNVIEWEGAQETSLVIT